MSSDSIPTQKPCVVDEAAMSGAGTLLPAGHWYCELIGSLLYIANTTRHDISQAAGVLSRYRVNPTTAHWSEELGCSDILR
jgi:hypothetical protein